MTSDFATIYIFWPGSDMVKIGDAVCWLGHMLSTARHSREQGKCGGFNLNTIIHDQPIYNTKILSGRHKVALHIFIYILEMFRLGFQCGVTVKYDDYDGVHDTLYTPICI